MGDAEGWLFIVGRTKEVINRGGEIVAPAEVEEAVIGCPGVLGLRGAKRYKHESTYKFASLNCWSACTDGANTLLVATSATNATLAGPFLAKRRAPFSRNHLAV